MESERYTAKYRNPGETDWHYGIIWNQRQAAEKDAEHFQDEHPMADVRVVKVTIGVTVEDEGG